jgi:hypothetical protein
MDQFLGAMLALYIMTAAIILPIIGFASFIAVRDCRMLSGEDCVWVIVPVSEAPKDQRPAPKD